MKTCPTCGSSFHAAARAQQYCSPKCKPVIGHLRRNELARKLRVTKKELLLGKERKCLHCGTPIPLEVHVKRIFCDTCRSDYQVTKLYNTKPSKKKPQPIKWNCSRCGSNHRIQEGVAVYCGDCFWHESTNKKHEVKNDTAQH